MNIDDTFYLSNITKPNHKPNQQIQLQYNDNIFQSRCYFIPCYIIVVLKRIIKGDNKGNTKEIKERVLRPKTVVESGGFFFLFYHLKTSPLSIPRSRSIDNSLIILLYPLIIPLYYPFYNNIIPLFLLLYIINMRVEKSGGLLLIVLNLRP